MDKLEYDTLQKCNEDDERRFSDFTEKCSFAIIAANWTISQQVPTGHIRSFWLISIALSLVFLILRGCGHALNIRHNWKILDTEQSKQGTYPDAGIMRTPEGQLSYWLYKVEPIVILLSAVIFIIICLII